MTEAEQERAAILELVKAKMEVFHASYEAQRVDSFDEAREYGKYAALRWAVEAIERLEHKGSDNE